MLLEYQNVKKSFGPKTVLRGVSFGIQKNQVLFILGKSGTGKSVLIKCAVGLLHPDEGAVIFANQVVSSMSEAELARLRRRCAVVFQKPALFDSLSVYDNIAYGLRLRRHFDETTIHHKVKKVCEQLGLSFSETQRAPYQLSFGGQKKVSLARTLVLDPELILFDEPTTGLDPVAISQVNEMIENVVATSGATVVVISHDMESAMRLADRIVFLDQGHLLADTTVAQIQKLEIPLIRDFLYDFRPTTQQRGTQC